MKVKLIIVLVIMMFVASCQEPKQEKPQKPMNEYNDQEGPSIDLEEGGEGGRDISNEEDIEPDINYIDIEEDIEMTEEAAENGAGDQDITIIDKSTMEVINSINTDEIEGELLEQYNTTIPEGLRVNLVYKQYMVPFDYILITKDSTKIYKGPQRDGEVLGSAELYVKVRLIARVRGQYIEEAASDEWYVLTWIEDGEPVLGYVTQDSGEPRRFRFDNMVEKMNQLSNKMQEIKYGYISNYKDRNGSPPLIDGKAIDKFGIQAYQSAPAYQNLENKDEFRYFPDGTIVFIVDKQDGHFKVQNLQYEGEYWIPKEYISFEDNIDNLDKVIVVDTTNQNQGVFEKSGEIWTMVSYGLATTGAKEKYKFETPKGFFKVLDKKERFYYLDDVTRELAGYGPYGTRFTAGAYIHGVPVAFEKINGENIDPGIQEYLFTIGTTPRSHKCVRNYTSQSKFIYDWSDPNDTAVIVIE